MGGKILSSREEEEKRELLHPLMLYHRKQPFCFAASALEVEGLLGIGLK